MAKDSSKGKTKKSDPAVSEKPVEKAAEPAAPPPAKVIAKPVVKPAPKEKLFTFSRWFQLRCTEKKYKPHWIAGMQASRDTKGRKTVAEWDKLFETY